MNINKINPWTFLMGGLVFIVIINGAFFYLRANKKTEPQKSENSDLIAYNKKIIDEATSSLKTSTFRIESSDYILGNADAALEMIIYDDPAEAFAPQYYETIRKVISVFGDKLKITLRVLPLELNTNTDYFSIAVLCAGEQGKYYEMYQEMIDANQNKKLGLDYPFGATSVFSLDMDKFKVCQQDERMQKLIEDRKTEAEQNTIIGVPSTFINNYPFPGAYQFEDFIDSAGFAREGLKTIIEKQLQVMN